MSAKIYDFNNRSITLTVELGDLGAVSFRKGKAVVDSPEKQQALEIWLNKTSAGMYESRDYDPALEAEPVSNNVPGTGPNTMVQGIMTSMGVVNPNNAILDSQLAQALVSGTVDELVAANPAVLDGVGFVPNSAPAKPNLSKK